MAYFKMRVLCQLSSGGTVGLGQ